MAKRTPAAEKPPAQAKKKAAQEAIPFEEALGQLEAVVERLEAGDLPLEGALASFEDGIRLTRQCSDQLEVTRRRIEELVEQADDWVRRPFDPPDSAEDDESEGWD